MAEERREYWRKLITEQERSGKTIRAFCEQRGIGDHCFYYWRRRLRQDESVRFALLNPVVSRTPLELYLASGERLRIGNGVDAATLRLVLDTLRR